MPIGNNQHKQQAEKTWLDWTSWILIVLIAAALFGFVALAFYLFS